MADLKEMHDRMVAQIPEGATHDEDACTFCMESALTGDDMADKTFTEAELKTALDLAVAEAVKPLQDKITELNASQESAEVDAKIAEATRELTEQLAAAEAERDTAVIEKQTAADELANVTAYLEGVSAEEASKAEAAERKDARVASVAEVASFEKDYVEKNAERWAAMDDESFDALLDDYKAAGAKPATAAGESTLPATGTALTAARETAGSDVDPVKAVIRLRDSRIDPRHI